MATLRNKRKLAAINRDNLGDHPRNNRAWNTNSFRIQEVYITQLSEKIEGWLTKKLSQEFCRTESRILGALSKLDEFLLSLQAWVHSGPVPETSLNKKQRKPGNE